MKLIRVGKRRVNLEYLILAEEWDGTPDTQELVPGSVRVTMETGREFVVNADRAETFLRRLDAEIDESEPVIRGAVLEEYDPATGLKLPLQDVPPGVFGGDEPRGDHGASAPPRNPA